MKPYFLKKKQNKYTYKHFRIQYTILHVCLRVQKKYSFIDFDLHLSYKRKGPYCIYRQQSTLVLLNSDIPCLSKQCRSRSQLIWICTICHKVCELIVTIWIKESDWLKIRSRRGILIYSAGQGLTILWAYSANIKLIKKNLFFPENKI